VGDKANSIIRGAGGKVKSWVSKMFGLGDYSDHKSSRNLPKYNSMMMGSQIPEMVGDGKRDSIFRHRECIGTVTSSQGFQTVPFFFNPGLPQSFPWLSTVASAYSQYKVLGAIVEYEHTIDNLTTNDASGDVVLSPRYNLSDAAPVNIIEAINTEGSVPGNPTENLLLGVECDPSLHQISMLNLRAGAVPTGEIEQLCDHCIIDVSNYGQADANAQIGRVFVTYEVQMYNKIAVDSLNGETLSDHFHLVNPAAVATFGTPTADPTCSLGGKIVTGNYEFPTYVTGGNWLVVLEAAGGTIAASASGLAISTTNCTRLDVWASSGGPDLGSGPCDALSNNSLVFAFVLQVTASGAVFAVTGPTSLAASYGDLFVTPLNGNMLTLHRSRRTWARYWRDAEQKREQAREALTGAVELAVRKALGERGIAAPSADTDDEKYDEVSGTITPPQVAGLRAKVPR